MNSLNWKRKELFALWHEKVGNMDTKSAYVSNHVATVLDACSENIKALVKKRLSLLCHEFQKRWTISERMYDRFMKRNLNWLNQFVNY